MLSRAQERHLRRALKQGGSLQLPGHAGSTVQVEVTRHHTFTAVCIISEGRREPEHLYGPGREVYPLVAERLDALVVPHAPEVSHE